MLRTFVDSNVIPDICWSGHHLINRGGPKVVHKKLYYNKYMAYKAPAVGDAALPVRLGKCPA